MTQTRGRKHRLKGSHERLLAITKDIDRIQRESLRARAVAQINQDRTRDLGVNLDELLTKQELSLKRLMKLSDRDKDVERLVAAGRE